MFKATRSLAPLSPTASLLSKAFFAFSSEASFLPRSALAPFTVSVNFLLAVLTIVIFAFNLVETSACYSNASNLVLTDDIILYAAEIKEPF